VAAGVTTAFGADAGLSGRTHQGLRVLDEAVRLLDLLQEEQPRRASASAGCDEVDADGDVPHRGGECRRCPVCRGLAALREANPEAVTRMTRAVTELAGAIGDLLAGPDRAQARTAPTAAPDWAAQTQDRWYATHERETAPRAAARTRVQRIDVAE
jgi:hypothetical protein